MNQDFDFISDWIAPNTRVLDLGCGDGALLHSLEQQYNVSAMDWKSTQRQLIDA